MAECRVADACRVALLGACLACRYLFDRSQVKLDLLDWQVRWSSRDAHREPTCQRRAGAPPQVLRVLRVLCPRGGVSPQGAVDDMSEALQRLPDAASLHYSRGMALYSMKEHSRALLVSGSGGWAGATGGALAPVGWWEVPAFRTAPPSSLRVAGCGGRCGAGTGQLLDEIPFWRTHERVRGARAAGEALCWVCRTGALGVCVAWRGASVCAGEDVLQALEQQRGVSTSVTQAPCGARPASCATPRREGRVQHCTRLLATRSSPCCCRWWREPVACGRSKARRKARSQHPCGRPAGLHACGGGFSSVLDACQRAFALRVPAPCTPSAFVHARHAPTPHTHGVCCIRDTPHCRDGHVPCAHDELLRSRCWCWQEPQHQGDAQQPPGGGEQTSSIVYVDTLPARCAGPGGGGPPGAAGARAAHAHQRQPRAALVHRRRPPGGQACGPRPLALGPAGAQGCLHDRCLEAGKDA